MPHYPSPQVKQPKIMPSTLAPSSPLHYSHLHKRHHPAQHPLPHYSTDKRKVSVARETRSAAQDFSPWIDLDHPIGYYEGCKMLLMLPVVVLKLLILMIAVLISWYILSLMLIGYDYKKAQPMSPRRRLFVVPWVSFWARFLLFMCGFYYISVTGVEYIRAAASNKQERSIMVFNHESYTDAAVMCALFAPSGVAKSPVASIPFFSKFAIALQFLFVQRRGSSDHEVDGRNNQYILRQDPTAAVVARAQDTRYPLVMLAPEATTKAKRCLLKFKKGAFSSSLPVVPVLLKYRYRHFNPGWGIEYQTPLHCYRLLAQFLNKLQVEVLPLYYPSNEEVQDPVLYTENVRRLMAEALGVPLVDESLHDELELVKRGVRPDWRGAVVLE